VARGGSGAVIVVPRRGKLSGKLSTMVFICFADPVAAGLRFGGARVRVPASRLPYNYQSAVLMERVSDVGAIHASAVLESGTAEKATCHADV